jgi:hypothetical protein
MFNSKKVRELGAIIERLEQLVKSHEVAYNELVEFYDKRNKELEDPARDLPVTLNFGSMDAFSVERIVQNGSPVTVVGYKLRKDVRHNNGTDTTYEIKEWYLHCNDKVHKDVVKQFNDYMEVRKRNMF